MSIAERPLDDRYDPHGSAPEEKIVLAAPRPPSTRWNRRTLAIAGTLLGTLLLVTFIGALFAASNRVRQHDAPVPVVAKPPELPIRAEDPTGYQTVLNGPAQTVPGTTPGCEQFAGSNGPPTTGCTQAAGSGPPPAPAGPTVAQQAREAAAASSPFFGGSAASSGGGESASGAPAQAAAAAAQSGEAGGAVVAPVAGREVEVRNGQGETRALDGDVSGEDYLKTRAYGPLSPYEVKAGAVIPAALITALNSDLPGEVVAQVTEPVYDHATARLVLIPQGARLIGRYDSQVAFGQSRVVVAWNRIIMPNGTSINIGSMTGADLTGASGLHDRVNNHFGSLLKGVLLSTMIQVGSSAAQNSSNAASGNQVFNSTGAGIAAEASQVGGRITDRFLNVQPTLQVRAGWPIRVIVSKDMILQPYRP
jgi:type IV secretory pathway VirB10-like protein